jgi:hypothetical protein
VPATARRSILATIRQQVGRRPVAHVGAR